MHTHHFYCLHRITNLSRTNFLAGNARTRLGQISSTLSLHSPHRYLKLHRITLVDRRRLASRSGLQPRALHRPSRPMGSTIADMKEVILGDGDEVHRRLEQWTMAMRSSSDRTNGARGPTRSHQAAVRARKSCAGTSSSS